jgi:hypothetical protein
VAGDDGGKARRAGILRKGENAGLFQAEDPEADGSGDREVLVEERREGILEAERAFGRLGREGEPERL